MHLDEFLLAAVILLTATAVFVSLFKRLGLGSVLGFLAAGMLVGPSGFAITKDVEGLRHFTELGVALFLFIIGLEMQPKKLWSMRRSVCSTPAYSGEPEACAVSASTRRASSSPITSVA